MSPESMENWDLSTADLRERVAELTAENARLKAELDQARAAANTILTASAGTEAAKEACRYEEPGTILRETDGMRREWVLDGSHHWQPR